MALQKLQNTDAFVVRDLDSDTPAIGVVRSAPKILQGGAKELARSQTYQCAVLEMQIQGASAGVNASPEDRASAVGAFCEELMPAAENGSLMLDPAKGISAEAMAPLLTVDGRTHLSSQTPDGIALTSHLLGHGAVAAASAVRPLEGLSVAIDNFESSGPTIARSVTEAGARVIAVSSSAGAAVREDGFDIDELIAIFTNSGPPAVVSLAGEELPAWKVLATNADVLFAGSKMGMLDHKNAESLQASLVVPTGPIPYTTKGALMLERQGATVLPDFVTTAGAILAGFMPEASEQASIESSVASTTTALVEAIVNQEASAILEACFAAERFLKTWRDELPFGRPFAA